jgi:predicted Ser/Thr protein kinase
MPDADDGVDDRLKTVLRDYLVSQDAGAAPSHADLLARYPDLSEELTAHFETAATLQACQRRLVPPLALAIDAIAGYEIQHELGRGGMGVVYRARQTLLGRTVALKVLRAEDAGTADRLVAEARAAARLDHPGIVPIFEVGNRDGRPFLAMAFVAGETLAARAARGPLLPRVAARIMRDVALAVQHANEQGVIHRDLKPANILLTPEGHPKVTDFGLAKCSGEATLSSAGHVLGTPAYMPPEFAAGDAVRAGPTADVYGLGAVLYTLLTGRAPFRGQTVLETIRRVAYDDPVPPRETNRGVDRAVEAICLRCLEKSPHHRYDSAKALAEDLDRYLADEVPVAEQLGWGDWLRRTLDRAIDFGRARQWSRLLGATAVANLAAWLGYYFVTRGATSATTFWCAFATATATTTWLPCFVGARMPRLDPREREILLFWLVNSVGQLVLFANHCPLSGAADADDVDRMFASASVLYGVLFFAQGRLYWGQFYLLGLACFATAVVLMRVGPLAPLVHGASQAAAFATISRHLFRVSRTHARVRTPE